MKLALTFKKDVGDPSTKNKKNKKNNCCHFYLRNYLPKPNKKVRNHYLKCNPP